MPALLMSLGPVHHSSYPPRPMRIPGRTDRGLARGTVRLRSDRRRRHQDAAGGEPALQLTVSHDQPALCQHRWPPERADY